MKNILLIGLGRFGKHIAMQLNQMGHEIMAVDINEERVNKFLLLRMLKLETARMLNFWNLLE